LRAFATRHDTSDERVLWSAGADIAARPVISCRDYLADDDALRSVLADIAQFGLARLSGAGTALDEVARVVARFGFIRETNYGRLFEVRVVADPDNLAFTARALEPHTDNPYRDPAPTLQLLHCIQDSGSGGATFFLDGFALAEWFRAQHAEDFATLSSQAVPFAYASTSGERYAARSPVLRLDANGRLTGLRFNHRALQAVDLGAADTARWYEAYLKFAKAADARERHFSFPMQPGDIVIFDNERILHGRDAFAGASNRLLRGCYSDRDGLLATLARLSRA
jgi:gamma-butyrobetaine dioxygenase